MKLDRNLWAADYNMGCLRLEQTNYPGAIDYLTTYVTTRTLDVNGYLLLGRARLRLAMDRAGYDRARHLDNARLDFEYAEKLRGTAEAGNALGLIELMRHGSGPETVKTAVSYFQAALQREPNYPPAILNLAIVQQRYLNAPKDSLVSYKQYLALQPPPADAKDVEKVAHQLDLDMRITIFSTAWCEQCTPPPSTFSNAAPRQDFAAA